MKQNRLLLFSVFVVTFGCGEAWIPMRKEESTNILPNGYRTTQQVTEICRTTTETRYTPAVEKAGIPFPPSNLRLLAFKEEKRLDIYTEFYEKKIWLHSYHFTAQSGKRGPKQKEGDRQIPEGIYGVEYLNPNSRFHLSFKITYPNQQDRERAIRAGIKSPGTDIFIHGGASSVGCIAIGDRAIEELFTLVNLTGTQNVQVYIFPNDARKNGQFLPCEVCSDDIGVLYDELYQTLQTYPSRS